MPAIVLLPGWGSTSSVFDELSQVLALRYEVHTPALRSEHATAGAARNLDAVASEIAARAPQQCFVVGWSLGAQIALAWARAKPDQVAGLALLSATPCFVQRDDWPWSMERSVFDRFTQTLFDDGASTLRRFVTLQAQGDAARKRVMQRLRSALVTGAEAHRDALAEGLDILRQSDLRGELSSIQTPAIVVHGERDRVVPLAAAEYLANALPHGKLAVMPRAAHAPFVSDPGLAGQLILDFSMSGESTLGSER